MPVPMKLPTDWTPGGTRALDQGLIDITAVVQGDTGWRNISSGFDATWSVTKAQIRRIGPFVFLILNGLTSVSGTAGEWVNALTGASGAIPAGFRPAADTDLTRDVTVSGVSGPRRIVVGAIGVLSVARATFPPQDVMLMWAAGGAFPESSAWPGTAVAA